LDKKDVRNQDESMDGEIAKIGTEYHFFPASMDLEYFNKEDLTESERNLKETCIKLFEKPSWMYWLRLLLFCSMIIITCVLIKRVSFNTSFFTIYINLLVLIFNLSCFLQCFFCIYQILCIKMLKIAPESDFKRYKNNRLVMSGLFKEVIYTYNNLFLGNINAIIILLVILGALDYLLGI
jgi:hypothetical protein